MWTPFRAPNLHTVTLNVKVLCPQWYWHNMHAVLDNGENMKLQRSSKYWNFQGFFVCVSWSKCRQLEHVWLGCGGRGTLGIRKCNTILRPANFEHYYCNVTLSFKLRECWATVWERTYRKFYNKKSLSFWFAGITSEWGQAFQKWNAIQQQCFIRYRRVRHFLTVSLKLTAHLLVVL